jgi:hypothetical protein
MTRSVVVDELRVFLNRPLRDSDRPRLFALAVAVILAVAGGLARLDTGAAPERPRPPAAVLAPPAAPTPRTAPSPSATATQAPSEEGRPPAGREASRKDVVEASRAARRFLRGYLPYTYGQRGASDLHGATSRLRSRLARQRPRVPAAERRRRPRVVLVHADGAGPRRAGMVALVSDGARRYTVSLELARTAAGWTVTEVGG